MTNVGATKKGAKKVLQEFKSSENLGRRKNSILSLEFGKEKAAFR